MGLDSIAAETYPDDVRIGDGESGRIEWLRESFIYVERWNEAVEGGGGRRYLIRQIPDT